MLPLKTKINFGFKKMHKCKIKLHKRNTFFVFFTCFFKKCNKKTKNAIWLIKNERKNFKNGI